MNFGKKLSRLFGKDRSDFDGGGVILFENTHDAMKAEQVFFKEGAIVKMIAPPVYIRKGCDLALEFNIIDLPHINRIVVDKQIDHISIEELDSNAHRPLDIVQRVDYGIFTMVQAGNMKLTINRDTGIIVNISGGGCPDIPFLYKELVGKKISSTASPAELGYTLCALMLERAYHECKMIIENIK